jgi:acyl-[acyl-carrier-protein]-phospholipid O-acyltransferase/long-chain-fatty-acid--[acyl-carrier-protein] ligase
VVLAIFGEYAKDVLGVSNTIYVQGVMALAGIGIVLGSIIAAKLSRYYVNVGLAGIGAVVITLIVISIPFIDSMVVIACLFTLFGLFSGFILVPLNSRIQELSARVHLGTILAANNFIQNIFMFVFLVITTIFAYYGMEAEVLFYGMGFVGLYLSYLLFKRYFNEIFWATMELISLLRHKYIYHGLENIPQDSAVLLLSNHVSWLDWIILQLPLSRKINYMMDKNIYHWKLLHPLFKKGEAIPVSPRGFKDAFKEAHARLQAGKIVGIFPEGEISKDGKLGDFHRGYELIAQDYDGVIVPVYIGKGIFGSVFSKYKPSKRDLFHRRIVEVTFLPPVPKESSAEAIYAIIKHKKEQDEAQ